MMFGKRVRMFQKWVDVYGKLPPKSKSNKSITTCSHLRYKWSFFVLGNKLLIVWGWVFSLTGISIMGTVWKCTSIYPCYGVSTTPAHIWVLDKWLPFLNGPDCNCSNGYKVGLTTSCEKGRAKYITPLSRNDITSKPIDFQPFIGAEPMSLHWKQRPIGDPGITRPYPKSRPINIRYRHSYSQLRLLVSNNLPLIGFSPTWGL